MRLKEIRSSTNVMVSSDFNKMSNLQLAQKYFEYLLAQKSARTLELYKREILKFLDFIEGYKINVISANDINSWLNEKGELNNTTMHLYLTVLSSFLEFLKLNGYEMNANPALQAQRLIGKRTPKQHEPVPLDELRKIMRNTTHPRDRAIIATLCKTGCRANELVNIKISDVLEDGVLIKNRKGSKNGEKDTEIPLDNELKSILQIWLSVRPPDYIPENGGYLFTTFFGDKLTTARIRGLLNKIAGIHPHQLRYSFTTFLSENRCNVAVIEKLRGDSPRTMTSYYTKIPWETIKKEYLAAMPKIS